MYEKSGGWSKALDDFDYISPKEVKKIQTPYGEGLAGKLDDRRKITVRPGSSDGRPTLEIRKPHNNRGIEIRYNESSFIEKVFEWVF